MDFVEELLRLIRALNARCVDYALIGDVALNVLGFVRATEDVDVFIAPTAENIDALKSALRDVWDDPSIDEISSEDLLGEYPAVSYGPPTGTLSLDILTRLGDFATYSDLEVETVRVRDVPIRVANARTLHWLKRDTVRPQDRADAQWLREALDFEEKKK